MTDPYYTGLHVRAGDLTAAWSGGPREVAWRRLRPTQQTPAMIAGSALHCAILEPGLFAARYAVKPEGLSLATREGKAWAAEHVGDRQIVPQDVADMGHALHPLFARITGDGGVVEVPVTATDDDGVPVACKPDWLRVTDDLIDLVSIKSSKHATPAAYTGALWTTDRYLGYDVAEAHYLSVLRLAYPDRRVRLRQVVIPTGCAPRLCVVELDAAELDHVDPLRRRLTAEAWEGLRMNPTDAACPAAEAWTVPAPRWAYTEEVPHE